MNPTFRHATLEDLEEVCDTLINLDDKVSAAYGITTDGPSLVAFAGRVVKEGHCLIGRGAVAGALIRPYHYNCHVKIGNIVFWNFTKPSGIHIFEAMLTLLASHGVTHFTCSSHPPDNRAGDIYRKHGFREAEVCYIKELSTPVL